MSDLNDVLLVNRKDIMTRTSLSGNTDEDKIYPHVLTAQDMGVQYALGTKLYDKVRQLVLDDTIGDAGNVNYKTLLDNYITPYLVFETMVDFIPFNSYEVSNGGVFQHQPEDGITPSKFEVDYLEAKYNKKSEYYKERMNTYLCANTSLFPEFNANTGSDVYPSGTGKVNIGIVI